jgi:adenosylcobyric acid synthase
MVQGTGSHVGKSVMVAALCRIFRQDGHSVAPFKSQNMALNSFVTYQGGEMGRAQVMQAQAAQVEPSVDMNPILLKPVSHIGAQVIVQGRPVGNMSAQGYHKFKRKAGIAIRQAYARLAARHDIIVIEGAGSPAEVNLRSQDVVNMWVARFTDAPVIITGDIDRGGVFASLIGTLKLLTPTERRRVKALHINKFRGDPEILKPGLEFLQKKSGKPLLGVTPYIENLGLAEEDHLPEERGQQDFEDLTKKINIGVLVLPHISNFTDFDPLEHNSEVQLRYLRRGQRLNSADVVIIPGTKNTIADLAYLKRYGYDQQIKELYQQGAMVIGICGGYQMLGRQVIDPKGSEWKAAEIEGLGLLDIVTVFEPHKITAQVKARPQCLTFGQGVITGYEIHMGRTQLGSRVAGPAFRLEQRGEKHVGLDEGAVSEDGRVWGTYIHGLFDNDSFRRSFLNFVRQQKGLSVSTQATDTSTLNLQQRAYDRLADIVRASLDMDLLYDILDNGIV